MNNVIDVVGLMKHYKKFTLGPIDFQVEKGTAVALVGTNGSGKSTVFRLLLNILQSDEGSIQLFGENMVEKETELKQKIGYVGDLYEQFGHFTIKELKSLVSYWYPSWDDERYSYLLKRYNIDDSEKFGKSSKGTKKKAEFIFSLCHDPKLLLLDEPSAGVDIVSQRKMKEDLMSFMEDGERSILLATHIVDEIKQVCDYIAVLEKGKLLYSFDKDEVYEKWARVWVVNVTDTLLEHPNVLMVGRTPPQIVTNNLPTLENELNSLDIAITHTQRLTLEEVIEHLQQTHA
ncbi:ATP-binding cassette domain-containing protein [Halalkalibacter kiskunsagensis]|uniref:ATP-binding cassette domain-containing protein n=1 Tax=Halalkalibacter kiskunsagensis TaxID=1548599 RepID=A0ABV6KBW9_9BACI